MNAPLKFDAATATVDEAAIEPFPNSRKVYVEGSRPDIRVPMREISQSPTPDGFGGEPNPPLFVYDTSGPYTDPLASIYVRRAGHGSSNAAIPKSCPARPPTTARRACAIRRWRPCASGCSAPRAVRVPGATSPRCTTRARGS